MEPAADSLSRGMACWVTLNVPLRFTEITLFQASAARSPAVVRCGFPQALLLHGGLFPDHLVLEDLSSGRLKGLG